MQKRPVSGENDGDNLACVSAFLISGEMPGYPFLRIPHIKN